MSVLDRVDTIVLLMLENRSFDHLLGHLSYGPYANGTAVEGLLQDGTLSGDLPHHRNEVATQLALSAVSGKYTMRGFAQAYFQMEIQQSRSATPDTLGFLRPADVPVTRFLVDNYAVCDHWFAPLPTSTQPNRIMSLAGTTRIDETTGLFPPLDQLVLQWLEDRHVRWRVYHSGISFFALLGQAAIFGPNFRSIDRLAADVANERPGDFPQVIIIEPSYGDAPHLPGEVANDNHAPLPVAPGEALLERVYDALTCNPDRWKKTLWILTYDEHGGFFDHVPPPAVTYRPASNAMFVKPFESLGVRVPTVVVSPLVSAQRVASDVFDHTSWLQLLAEKFAPGTPYSAAVEERRQQGVGSASQVLDRSTPRTGIPRSPPPPPMPQGAGTLAGPARRARAAPVPTDLQRAFEAAARSMFDTYPRATSQQYPQVAHWALTTPPPDAPSRPRQRRARGRR
ncbi:MAG: alkaline phosphatase family protein [Gemmatimonadota bacterium]